MKDEQVKGLNISKSKTEIFVYDFGGNNWEVYEVFDENYCYLISDVQKMAVLRLIWKYKVIYKILNL